jgi:hypothetical protein
MQKNLVEMQQALSLHSQNGIRVERKRESAKVLGQKELEVNQKRNKGV